MMSSGFIILPILFALLSLLVLILGWRGRRINDHPWCRRCKYDLIGSLPEAKACPECGADLTAPDTVRTGQRRRQPRLITTGIVAVSIAVAIGILQVWSSSSNFDWNTVKPVWWLVSEAGGTPDSISDAALNELLQRQSVNKLSSTQINDLVGRALSVQADPKRKWQPQWGDVVATARANGNVSDKQWHQYAMQAFDGRYRLVVRPRIRIGDPIAFSEYWRAERLGTNARFQLTLGKKRWSIGPITHVTSRRGLGGSFMMEGLGTGTVTSRFELPLHQIHQLQVGKTTIKLTRTAKIHDDIGDFQTGSLIGERTITIEVPIEFVPTDQPTVVMITDGRIRQMVRDAFLQPILRVTPRPDGWRLHCELNYENLPVIAAFDVFLRDDDREWKVVAITCQKNIKAMHGFGGHLPKTFDAQSVDVVLRPSIEAAKRTVHLTEIWGEEVVIKNVPVQWKK